MLRYQHINRYPAISKCITTVTMSLDTESPHRLSNIRDIENLNV